MANLPFELKGKTVYVAGHLAVARLYRIKKIARVLIGR